MYLKVIQPAEFHTKVFNFSEKNKNIFNLEQKQLCSVAQLLRIRVRGVTALTNVPMQAPVANSCH